MVRLDTARSTFALRAPLTCFSACPSADGGPVHSARCTDLHWSTTLWHIPTFVALVSAEVSHRVINQDNILASLLQMFSQHRSNACLPCTGQPAEHYQRHVRANRFSAPLLELLLAFLLSASCVPMAGVSIVDLPYSLLGSLFEIVIDSNGNAGDVARLAMVRAQLCCVSSPS